MIENNLKDASQLMLLAQFGEEGKISKILMLARLTKSNETNQQTLTF